MGKAPDEAPRVLIKGKSDRTRMLVLPIVTVVLAILTLSLWMFYSAVIPQHVKNGNRSDTAIQQQTSDAIVQPGPVFPESIPSQKSITSNSKLPASGPFSISLNRITLTRPNPQSELRAMELDCYCTNTEEQAALVALMSHGVLWTLRTDLGPLTLGPQELGVPQRAIKTHKRGDIRLSAKLPAAAAKIESLTAVFHTLYANTTHRLEWNDLSKAAGTQRSHNAFFFTLNRFKVTNDIADIGLSMQIPRGLAFEPDYWATYLMDYRLYATDGTVFSGASGGMMQKTATHRLNGKVPSRFEVEYVEDLKQDTLGFSLRNIPLPEDCPAPTNAFVEAHPAGVRKVVTNGYSFTLENVEQVSSTDSNGTLKRKTIMTVGVVFPGKINLLGASTFLPNAICEDVTGRKFESESNAGSLQSIDGQTSQVQAEFETVEAIPFIQVFQFKHQAFVADKRETVVVPLTEPEKMLSVGVISREPIERFDGQLRVTFSIKDDLIASRDFGDCGFKYEIRSKDERILPSNGSEMQRADGIVKVSLYVKEGPAVPATLVVRYPAQGHLETTPVEFRNFYLRASAPGTLEQKQF